MIDPSGLFDTDLLVPVGYLVYKVSVRGRLVYIGITKNITQRTLAHKKRFADEYKCLAKEVDVSPLIKDLLKDKARLLEQTGIDLYGLSKNGGSLANKINSIGKNGRLQKPYKDTKKDLLNEFQEFLK